MAYVTPTTVSTGCLISAASWNQNVVNNVIQLATSPLTYDFVNDRIGIRNSAPAVALEVNSDATAFSTRFRGTPTSHNAVLVSFFGGSSLADLWVLRTDFSTNGTKNFGIVDNTNLVTRMGITASGAVLINTTASNTFNTQGLTIQHGTTTNEALSLKSSTTGHGMTAFAETDTHFTIAPIDSHGGAWLSSYSASDSNNLAMEISGNLGRAADTTKSNAAVGIVSIVATVKSGTGITNAASTGNILVVANNASARFVFQGGGDLYADSGLSASAFDAHDDVALVRALEVERAPESVIRDRFDAWLKYGRRDLEAANIATFNDRDAGGDGSVFVNVTGLQRLHSGAIWQLHKRNQELEERLEQLEEKLTRMLLGPPHAPPAV